MKRKSIELRAALYYATTLKWKILPAHSLEGDICSCGNLECSSVAKHPRVREGLKAATADAETIRNWWRQWPDANIGVHAGHSGLVVIDVDPRHGGRVEDLPLSDADRVTPSVSTGGGGWHFYFRTLEGLDISNSSKRLPDGTDVRAGEGYVIAPPSEHEAGQSYAWLPERAPWEVEPRPVPDALLPLLVIKREPSHCDPACVPSVTDQQVETGKRHPYVEKALHDELDKLAQAREGNRNNSLNQIAFNLGQFIEAGLLPRGEVEALLEAGAKVVGLCQPEIRRTIKSGIEAGIRNPRRVWPDWRR
jgi:hypothetical protein